MKVINVILTDPGETTAFAGEELVRCLEMLGYDAQLSLETGGPSIAVGLGLGRDGLPRVEDARRDDAILIEVAGMAGVITGTNARSVLIAVYRFAHELGIWFVHPGADGTLVRSNGRTAVSVCERASYRHRGFCIEGAVSFENVLDFVDWLPKNGFNTYFTQFLIPYEFFKTWYAHANNPMLIGMDEVPGPEEVERFTYETLARELAKRGIVFQAAGHGWTTNAIGITGLGWDVTEQPVAEDKRPWLAQIDGKRAFFHGRPLNTNLCYSNPAVREAVTDEALRFALSHPQVEELHFWLADDSDNTCECEGCRQDVPAAFYLDMLNLLDEKMTRAGLGTRIVLLAYLDLLWPPQTGALKRPERFIFMFAPITRSYSKPLPCDAAEGPLPPFWRNRLQLPRRVEDNISFLRAWQRVVPCDSFIYEYHYMWDQFKDISDYANARILWQDIRGLKALGLNGFISCQQTRVFFPCGFGMYVMGRTLWDREVDFESLSEAFFGALFGGKAGAIVGRLRAVSEGMRPQCLRGEAPVAGEANALAYRQLCRRSVQEAGEYVRRLKSATGFEAEMWSRMALWAQLCAHYAYYLEACALSDEAEKALRLESLKNAMRAQECAHQEAFDVYWFCKTLDTQIVKQL